MRLISCKDFVKIQVGYNTILVLLVVEELFMCVSMHQADFEDTCGSVSVMNHPVHGLIHVLGYKNKAQNLANGANAMIIHVPSAEPMGKDNLITHTCGKIYEDMWDAVTPIAKSFTRMSIEPTTVVVEYGIYTVILGPSLSEVVKRLPEVPEYRRPTISQWAAPYYDNMASKPNIALFCFNNKEAKTSVPILMWYKPANPELVQFPGLDSHTGNVPEDVPVEVNHRLFFSHYQMQGGSYVSYTDPGANEIKEYLPRRVYGAHFGGKYRNGDFVLPTDVLLRGDPMYVMYEVERVMP